MVNSKIQWTDNTWNVAVGCSKVSPGCKFCYMMRDFSEGSFKGGTRKDSDGNYIPVNGIVTRTKPSTFNKPLSWQKKGLRAPDGSPLKVFTSSLTDVFHEQIDSYRDEVWAIIRQCPDLIFQILTKRPERINQCLPEDWGEGYPNVWIGTTVENEKRARERIPLLRGVKARIRFISFEPLLDEITYLNLEGIHWAIIGGESGNENGKWTYRKAYEWQYKELIHLLTSRDIPIFFKQLGTHISNELRSFGIKIDRHGGEIDTLPEEYDFLKIREFPHLIQEPVLK